MDSLSGIKDGIDIFHNFVALHKPQLQASGVPGHFWEILSKKLHYQIFDAGESFSLLKINYEEGRKEHEPIWKVIVSAEGGINQTEPCHIYLIDHAWTYKVSAAKHHLREIPGLLERMLNLMDIPNNNDGSVVSEELVGRVFDEMWKFNQTYTVGPVSNVEERLPVWYIMDEFGSAIQHSDKPTFRIVPFIYMPDQVAYSLLFPVQNLTEGEEVTRDFVEGYIQDSVSRQALLLPWRPNNFLTHTFEHVEPDSDYFLEGHIAESLPNYKSLETYNPEVKNVMKVFSEYSFINSYLTHSKFEIVDNEDDADILWYTSHFKNFKNLSETSPHKYVNQFPFEYVITVKDLLTIACHRKVGDLNEQLKPLESYPIWFPTTYNLRTELSKFVSYYQHREKIGLDNHWICKPFNLARGLDTHITNNLNYILRLPFTGPKIAQKYIEDPVLFNRPEIGYVKFDIRYVLVLKSVAPLTVYAYRNFFLRFANVPFELQDFENYEKHFTVMNYNDSANLCRMLCDEFVVEFEKQYNLEWSIVEEKIFEMLHSMFVSATSKSPPAGIAHNPQSRAVYAADLMLSWREDSTGNREMQPKLLEVNWCPDCQRACEYYPDFYNDIFGLLFVDEEKESSFRRL
ncbi:hypothetical protein R5R35_003026 [Gryllus longicercus]|uniref:Tubulin--tyrosine ligase-like protein 12 SET-like domain-containing protein n=1 Tax=Gryllus longicercus TaxID=2509291 RepID=A0AAN9VN94_9ORTH